ncbi:hypothetical protein TNCV_3170741 [Trichonephila clavipes]|nr:hypothetical protein TNCV_3170741 [Trichonephila clavipes]
MRSCDNSCVMLLDHLTQSLPVPTDDVVSWVFIESSALEQVVAMPRQQPGQASGGILPGGHARWLGKSRKRLRLSPGAAG